MKYKNEYLKKDIINDIEKDSGGFISLDKNENLEMPFMN
jgi:hypothetical protein